MYFFILGGVAYIQVRLMVRKLHSMKTHSPLPLMDSDPFPSPWSDGTMQNTKRVAAVETGVFIFKKAQNQVENVETAELCGPAL